MYKIELKDEDMKNLLAFLERTTMTGKEAILYLRIIQTLQNAEREGD